MSFVRQLLLAAGAFAGASLVAGIAGATNAGTALAFGQIAFAVTVVTLLLRA